MFKLLLEVFDVGWSRETLEPHLGSSLIHDINGLVRQEATGYISVGEYGSGIDGFVGYLGPVVGLIAVAKPLQNGNGILHSRFINHYGLKTPLQG